MKVTRCARVASLALTALLCSASSLSAADHFVGPGQPHAQITSAIAAASPGDRVFVMAGTYEPFVLDKALEVRGSGPDLTRIGSSSPGGRTVIFGIASGAIATVADMSFEELSSVFTTGGPLLDVDNNHGTVVLQRVSVHEAASIPHVGEGVRVRTTTRMIAQSCLLRGPLGPQSGGPGSPGLLAMRSSVQLIDTAVIGSDFTQFPFVTGAPGAPGMVVADGALDLVRVEVRGGSGGLDELIGETFDGGAGLVLTNAHAEIRGGPNNLLKGGPALLGGVAEGGPGIVLFSGSVAQLMADVHVEGGVNGSGSLADPFQVTFGTTLANIPVLWPTLAVLGAPAPLGTNALFEHSGQAGSVVLRAIAPGLASEFFLAPIGGALSLGAAGAFFLPAVTLDAGGLRTSSAAVPALPALAGAHVWSQCIELAGSALLASNPARIAIAH